MFSSVMAVAQILRQTFTITVRAALSCWKILTGQLMFFDIHHLLAFVNLLQFPHRGPQIQSCITCLLHDLSEGPLQRGALAAALWTYESCGITGSQVWHQREKVVRINVSTNPTCICGNSPPSSFLYGLTFMRYLTFSSRNSQKEMKYQKYNPGVQAAPVT